MKKHIAVLKGDGIGPEVINQSLKILDAIGLLFGHQFIYDECLVGGVAIDKTGSPLPEQTVTKCQSADAILLGAIGDPKFDNDPSATIRPEQGLLKLRKNLGLYANIRPIKIYNSLRHLSPLKEERLEGVDMVIYRELTGGIYFGKKDKGEDYASDLCLYHKHEIERIANLAFLASTKRRRKLCLVDKANVLESSRLWRKTIQDMSKHFPEVSVSYLYVDNAAMQLIVNPAQFDVILTSNMFGDILSDEASVLSGSIGLLASASFGSENKLYEPIHGSYPQAKGLDIANPIASILSVEMMLRDFNMIEEADVVKAAVDYCIENNLLTEDINKKSNLKCSEVGNAMSKQIAKYKTVSIY
jgi:3-isopropylmalate dehydrogenase